MSAIRVQGLTKCFVVKKKSAGFTSSLKSLFKPETMVKTAVHPLDFSVEQGETLAFLGPNGAGKSTTIKMLTGILHPSSGSAEVLGCKPWADRKRLAFHIGSVFGQKSQLWYHLPAADSFELMSRIYELNRMDFAKRQEDLVERFEIGPYMNIPVRKLSLGERMRCELAAALLHRPNIVFLDEPTIGLDVVVKHKIRQLILEMNREEGTTVFLTSHDSGDIEQLCKRAIVINHGQLILDQDVATMKRELLTHKSIRLQLLEDSEPLSMPGVETVEHTGQTMRLAVDTRRVSMEAVLARIVAACRIQDVTIEDPSMEEIITHIYARKAGVGVL
ncbi:ABC transporter ATP-binding protein [Paenibacillus thalictri]|uniref:ABC transporter ATP-binding protein n=1 Tax=Paenibacillus thalictri TaxID=2527873 RepID=A0A4Q9DXI6_9BACL|nr:ATP-binding cassette domain-containing protein [Paenibacillus thalictri]TBL81829.1 ABC transporter ATP-binding protein [Paenibacillus thalictri]